MTEFLSELGLSQEGKTTEKALSLFQKLESFTLGDSSKPLARFVLNYYENKRQYVTIFFNGKTFFYLYDNPALSTEDCIGAYVTAVKKKFRILKPNHTMAVLDFVIRIIQLPMKERLYSVSHGLFYSYKWKKC